MALHKQQEQICRELGNKGGLSTSLGNQALILYDRGDLDGAMALRKQQEQICRELGNVNGLAISLANQALLLQNTGQHAEAVARAEEGHRLAVEHGLAALSQQIKRIVDSVRHN